MTQLRLLSAAEQVAVHLITEIQSGQYNNEMPGAMRLSKTYGVNHKTMESALQLLEKKQILRNNGTRKCRTIKREKLNESDNKCLRIGILTMEKGDENVNYFIELKNLLEENGHKPFFTEKSLIDLKMDPRKVSNFINKNNSDAWVVGSGSREILKWFHSIEVPTFALFGHYSDIPIAAISPEKSPALTKATRHLIKLGHQRITLLCRKHLRGSNPTPFVSTMLKELENSGIKTSDFNLPEWQEDKKGFNEIMNSLFKITPPTAIIADEAFMYTAVLQYLAEIGLRVPKDVSLICTDNDANFEWCEPSVSHIRWESRPVVRRIVRWANNISLGKKDTRQSVVLSDFVLGGTTGSPQS